MPEEENKKGNGKNGDNGKGNGKKNRDLSNIKNLEDFRASSNINNINSFKKDNKKDISYTDYYKIKTGIELSRQQLKKHLEELEQLAKRKGIPTPSEVLAQEAERERFKNLFFLF